MVSHNWRTVPYLNGDKKEDETIICDTDRWIFFGNTYEKGKKMIMYSTMHVSNTYKVSMTMNVPKKGYHQLQSILYGRIIVLHNISAGTIFIMLQHSDLMLHIIVNKCTNSDRNIDSKVLGMQLEKL